MPAARFLAAFLVMIVVATPAPAAAAKSVAPAPFITSISPASAARGATVTLTGRDFGGPQTRIWVGNVSATLLSGNGSRATFQIPATAPFGPTFVRLANPSGQSHAVPFTVLYAGTLTPRPAATGAVTQIVGRSGGVLSSAGLQLSIPEGALSADVSITMRPLQGVSGSPFDASYIGGVKLEPDGLAFLVPATLSIPLPAGIRAADILAFGSTGSGAGVHLEPYSITGGSITLSVWHFSTESAAAAGASGAAAMLTMPPTSAENTAMQAIAIANAACAQEQAANINDGPACANQKPAHISALLDWAVTVRPGLQNAIGAPYFTAEAAIVESMRWWAQVQLSGVSESLASSVSGARATAVAVLADQAGRRLGNCTGTSLTEQLRDVARLADIARAAAITEPLGTGLPSAGDGSIIAACASVSVDELELPNPAARGTDRNTLKGRASLDVWSGPNRTDVPLNLAINVTGGGTSTTIPHPDAQGRFEAPLFIYAETSTARVDVTATSDSPLLQFLGIDQHTATITRSTRDRLELSPGDVTIEPGATLQVSARLAGDNVANRTIAFQLTGPGSLSSSTASTSTDGAAAVTFTAGTVFGTTVLKASFVDGSVTRTKTITITVDADVSVSISPETVIVETSAQQAFTATVSGAEDLGVTWSATCGSVTSAGMYTAPASAGSCNVTARSVEDTGASATAIVTVVDSDSDDPPAGVVVTVSPEQAYLARGGSQQFTATVTGTSNMAVTWTARCGGVSLPISAGGLFSVPSDLPASQAYCLVFASSAADPRSVGTALAHVGWIEIISTQVDACADAYDSISTDPDPGACASGLGASVTATQGGASASTSMSASIDLVGGHLAIAGNLSGNTTVDVPSTYDSDGFPIDYRQGTGLNEGGIFLTFRVVGDRVPWSLDFEGNVTTGGELAQGTVNTFAVLQATYPGGFIMSTSDGDQPRPYGLTPYAQLNYETAIPSVTFTESGWMTGGTYIVQLHGGTTIFVNSDQGGSASFSGTLAFSVGPSAGQ